MNKELNLRQLKTIQNFWNWFINNEQTIFQALKLNQNSEEVMVFFNQNLKYVSKRISCFFYENPSKENNYYVQFTAYGYKKLRPKLIALGDAAPKLTNFTIQTGIKPLTSGNSNQIPEGLKEIINQTWIKLEDYNRSTKKLKLILYIPNELNFDNNFTAYKKAELILMYILGEEQYKNHIEDFKIEPSIEITNGLLFLTELQEFLDYLVKINYSRKLKLIFE